MKINKRQCNKKTINETHLLKTSIHLKEPKGTLCKQREKIQGNKLDYGFILTKISRGYLANSLEIQEIQLSKAVAILFGATVKMEHSDTKLPPSANKRQPQYNTGVDTASISELVLDDLDNGFLETLDNLLPDTSV